MPEMKSGMETCASCNHFEFCMIYWGIECKRQRGKRIPRMKSTKAKARQKVDKKEQKNSKKPVIQSTNIFEPISTRVVNW